MSNQQAQQMTSEDFAQALRNATAYPFQVTDASAPGASRGGPADETQRIVDSALRAVLGGRTRVDDPGSLKAALARSFVEERIDGRRVYRNVPRGSLSDIVGEGEVSGFQAALMTHAREVVEHGLPLLDGLKSLAPGVGDDDIVSRAAIVRSNVVRLRDEFGRRDGPRPAVVQNILDVLLGNVETNPDLVGGVVGGLRDRLGLETVSHANNVEDEHQLTSYRLLAEYIVGLRTAWLTASPLLGAGTGPRFVSAQLRHVELMMQTITESLNQVRASMDSVFLGEAERRVQTVRLGSLESEPPGNARMTVEELLEWAEETVSPDSITLIREGGRIAITDSLLPTSRKVGNALNDVASGPSHSGALGASRVMASLKDLGVQWENLIRELEGLTVQSIEVPDLRGKPPDEAERILSEKGLEPELESAPGPFVESSDPAQGSRVLPGAKVTLTFQTNPWAGNSGGAS